MANVDFGNHYKKLVQFFWDPEPRNDDISMGPVWCLGRSYAARSPAKASAEMREQVLTSSDVQEFDIQSAMGPTQLLKSQGEASSSGGKAVVTSSSSEEDRGWPSDFLDDFESRFWFTYRSHFPPIKKSSDLNASSSLTLAVRLRSQLIDQGGFTSDTGWGCMIRSGQCLIGNALAILRLGRDWRRGTKQQDERELLSLFADDPAAPFSLHRFVEHGSLACGKQPGEWFGPSATARCIEALSQKYEAYGLKVYVTGDGADVYEDIFLRLAEGKDQRFSPVLILVGIRLGIDRVTPVYWEALKKTLQLPQSVGIAGGRPSASHYFVGHQGDHFFYLDPHQTRPKLPYCTNSEDYIDDDVASCHTRRLRRLHVEKLDPSMLIAFLIQDKPEWHSWKKSIVSMERNSVLHIAEREPVIHQDGNESGGAVHDFEIFDEEDDQDDECVMISSPTPL